MRRFSATSLVFLILCLPATAQENGGGSLPLVLNIRGDLALPVGSDSEVFNPGGGGRISIGYWNPDFPWVSVDLGAAYRIVPVDVASHQDPLSVHMVSGGLCIGGHYQPAPRLDLSLFGEAGYTFGFRSDGTDSAGFPYYGGGLGVGFRLAPSMSLGLAGEYTVFHDVLSDVTVSLNTTFHFNKRIAGTNLEPLDSLEFDSLLIDPIYPVMFKYYDTSPLGVLEITNSGGRDITDMKVTFLVPDYMDEPKTAAGPAFLAAGETTELELLALFNRDVLTITVPTKAGATISVEGTVHGRDFRNTRTETIRLFSRNEITWDDDRKAAAFVASTDPTVLKFSKNVLSMVKNEIRPVVDENLMKALAIHESLVLYGMEYVVDPASSYSELSEQTAQSDYLQFPNQTLDYRAGDCDDLSILYAALLESVNVETAFITVPGHIFMAFALEATPDEARRTFGSINDFIIMADKVWMPLETTTVDDDFLSAWRNASRQWKQNVAIQEALMYPVHEAWELYEAVGITGDAEDITMPPAEEVINAFNSGLDTWIRKEIGPRIQDLLAAIESAPGNHRYANSLAVLYARYGMLDDARRELENIISRDDYVPALMNLGNIEFSESRFDEALTHYRKASGIAGENPVILLSLARTYHELEDYSRSEAFYQRVKADDPALAGKFTYLAETGTDARRASEVRDPSRDLIWEEE